MTMILVLGRAACCITHARKEGWPLQGTPLLTVQASPPDTVGCLQRATMPRAPQLVHGINVTQHFPGHMPTRNPQVQYLMAWRYRRKHDWRQRPRFDCERFGANGASSSSDGRPRAVTNKAWYPEGRWPRLEAPSLNWMTSGLGRRQM